MELLDAVRTQKERTRLVLNNILFATDFSPSSEMALRYALTLARHYHAKIHIIHGRGPGLGRSHCQRRKTASVG